MTAQLSGAKYAPGMRVLIRDAEWLVKQVDYASNAPKHDPYELTCIGISNIVRGKLSRFISAYEDKIEILRPEETRLVNDNSPKYVKSKLFIESLLRRTPATDAKIHIAQHAAMDVLPYQLKPAQQALEAVRPRILIADAVGIGKTLEAGILVSELIERGRGRRILVLAVKAMLEQFQKEFWNRFSIPLTRLDSDGFNRLLQRIPAGHNPFHYVDKAIISIDTLKKDSKYRDFINKAYWDIILIDEAHNVADRGTNSDRSRLAKRLANRSDALIMLSATPHDGKPESFASLIQMLDPTVIADPSNYTVDDFKDKGLVIRRFKGDIKDEAKGGFLERDIQTIEVSAGDKEEEVYKALHELKFSSIDENHKPGTELFKTTLTKALFSSPAACISTVKNRLKKLEAKQAAKPSTDVANDIESLNAFLQKLEGIKPSDFSKFQALVKLLNGTDGSDFAWNKKDPEDRLVIFTESRETLAFLIDHLPKAIGLKAEKKGSRLKDDQEVVALRGDDSDTDLMDCVERFNKADSPVRLMLATDVASEGLNLHRLCHRLIHFDIPWSLMTFQQRNGRVDRYGQKHQPLIRYMQTLPRDESLKSFGDAHIIELLVKKDENAQKNIADPREFAGTKEEQEARTVAEVQGEAQELPDFDPSDSLTFFFGNTQSDESFDFADASEDEPAVVERSLVFPSDFDFVAAALRFRQNLPKGDGRIQATINIDETKRVIDLTPPIDLDVRLTYLPKEVLPQDRYFHLTDSNEVVQTAIRNAALNPNSTWPTMQLLWELHPVIQWTEDWAIGAFGRHSAPILHLPNRFEENEVWVLLQAGYPNRRGYTPVHDWIAVRVSPEGDVEVKSRRDLMDKVRFDKDLVNVGHEVDAAAIEACLPVCVDAAINRIVDKRKTYEAEKKPKLEARIKELDALREKQLSLFDAENLLQDDESRKKLNRSQLKALEKREFIEDSFREANNYVHEVFELGSAPFVQVAAVFCGDMTRFDHFPSRTKSAEREKRKSQYQSQPSLL